VRNVMPQDRHQLGGNGDDADGPARPVFQAAFFVPRPGVGPVLAHCWRGLMQLKTAPPGFGKMAIIGPERERLGRAQHREVQAGEEPDETSTATRTNGPDSGKKLAHLLGRGDHAGIDLIDAAVGRFPFGGGERVFGQPSFPDGVFDDVVQDTAASAEVVRGGGGAVERERVEDLTDDLVVLKRYEWQRYRVLASMGLPASQAKVLSSAMEPSSLQCPSGQRQQFTRRAMSDFGSEAGAATCL